MTGPGGGGRGEQRHTYLGFRDLVANALADVPEGLPWNDLRERMGWDRERPCYTWAERPEMDIGMRRVRRGKRVYWTVGRSPDP